ncbi:MAG: hypothetical protein WCW01_04945 [Gammaproteobacteria bacterium]
MAKRILAATSLSRNDIQRLANILKTPLEYFQKHNSPMAEDYSCNMKTVAGLGFTASLVGNRHACSLLYEEKLKTFRRYCDAGLPLQISTSLAEMVSLSLQAFLYTGYPGYADYFAGSLKQLTSHVSLALAGQGEEAKEICRMICGGI